MNKYLIISFFASKRAGLQKLKQQWQQNTVSISYLGRNLKETQEVTNEELGGELVVLDPANLNNGIIRRIDIPVPMGMAYHKLSSSLLVASDFSVYKVKSGKSEAYIKHRLFNNLHDVKVDVKSNIYLVSTGIDSLLEFSPDGEKLIWFWVASHHGYNTAANGKVVNKIDIKRNFSDLTIPTLEQVTHVNSILPYGKEEVLATFFHQGKIVKIDKNSGKVSCIVSGLKSPHNIRKINNGFIVSDTSNNRVLKFNKNFKITNILKGTFDWIQDSIAYDNTFFIADANNGRLAKLNDNGIILDEYRWDPDEKKVGGLEIVKETDFNNIFCR